MELGTGTPANELRNIVLKTYSKEFKDWAMGCLYCLSGKAWRSPLCEPKSFGRELAKGHEGRRPIKR